MGDTYICDECDRRIDSGYTVCWTPKLTDSPSGVHFSHGKETRNLCEDCFPAEQKTLTDRVREMLP